MRIDSKYLRIPFGLVITLIICTSFHTLSQAITCEPSTLYFGQVNVGTTSNLIITCTANSDGYSLGGALVLSDSVDFTITPDADSLPFPLAVNTPAYINVEFLPTIVGPLYQTPYEVYGTYDDGSGYLRHWYEFGMMNGEAVIEQPPLLEDAGAILEFIDESVDSGTLEGEGPGKAADNRLNALRNMIEAAGEVSVGVYLSEYVLYSGVGNQSEPRISGDQVVFSDLGSGFSDILVGDINTATFDNVTNTELKNEKLNDIDGDLVVYSDINEYSIVMINAMSPFSAPLTIPGTSLYRVSRPRIQGDYIVYERFNGTNYDTWAKEVGGDGNWLISRNPAGDPAPGDQRDPAVSNGTVVYTEDGSNVWWCDVLTADCTYLDEGKDPDIDGNWIVYSKQVAAGDYDVFLYDINSGQPPQNLTNRPGDQMRPTIAGNNITYDDNSAGNWDVYLYVIEENLTIQITNEPSNQRLAHVGDGIVVYEDDRNDVTTGIDIYATDFSVTTSLEACEQLEDALKKCDGEPEDFVDGEARVELYDMIEAFMDSIGCY